MRTIPRIVLLVVLCLIVYQVSTTFFGSTLQTGVAPPPLQAEGWLQGEAPTWEELSGKVVVLDVWAFW